MIGARRTGGALLLAMLAAAALIAAGLAGTATGGAGAGRALSPNDPLSYEPDAPATLRGVTPEFVAEQLGADFAAATNTPPATTPASGPAVAAPTVQKEFRCVNGRQTDDPLSPPCVDEPTAGNPGATWQGVTADEIKVVLEMPSGTITSFGGDFPTDIYHDVGAPSGARPLSGRAIAALVEYFNRRYETYGRNVRAVLHFSASYLERTDVATVSQAAEVDLRHHPFALLFDLSPPYASDLVFELALADRGVTTFDVNGGRPRAFGAQRPGMLWTLRPSAETEAEQFASFVCRQVVGRPVTMSGNLGQNGRPRRLALALPADPQMGNEIARAGLVRQMVERCGGRIEATLQFPTAFGGCEIDALFPQLFPFADVGAERQVAVRVAQLQSQGITTVLWPGCPEPRVSRYATALGWRPEWVLLGDGAFDRPGRIFAMHFPLLFHRHAVMVTPIQFEPPLADTRCVAAIREIDPSVSAVDMLAGCPTYPLLRQLFTGIQLAGPVLDPGHLEAGFRRFPPVVSADPQVPSCGFADGEYACIRDAQVQWWDGFATDGPELEFGLPVKVRLGCWRSMEAGRRYLPDGWPARNIDDAITPDDPCSFYQVS